MRVGCGDKMGEGWMSVMIRDLEIDFYANRGIIESSSQARAMLRHPMQRHSMLYFVINFSRDQARSEHSHPTSRPYCPRHILLRAYSSPAYPHAS